ncbi:MAG: MMPL family transporter [Deltaproteobacteria bacterium]|nr:MMPL family transporter [Deltaproteobacteria bacterium]
MPSALTTVMSFGSLAFSSHTGTANMGTVLTVGMVITVAINLILLPALIERHNIGGPRHGRRTLRDT